MNYTIKEEFTETQKSVNAEIKIEVSFTDEELHNFKYNEESNKLDELQKFVHERALKQFNDAKRVSLFESSKKV